MMRYRKTSAYTKNLLKKELLSAKTLAVYLFILALCGCVFFDILSQMGNVGNNIGYWEMADCMFGSYRTQLFYLLGMLVLISGIPYVGKEMPYYLIRGNKADWVTSNVLLLITQTIMYYVFVCIAVAVCILPRICMDNRWTEVYERYKNGIGDGSSWMDFSEQMYHTTTPLPCFFILLIEAILCSILTGMIVFLFSMYKKRRMGILICVLLFNLNSLLIYAPTGFSFFKLVFYINPVSFLSQYWLGEERISGTPGYAVAFMFLAIIGVYCAIRCRMKKSDWMVET